MKDKEIIKALEEYEVVCDECACNDGFITGKKIMLKALDLINRQQAEIEQLDLDRNTYQNLYCQMVEDLETAKTEAIKEFAEKLKLSIVTRLSEQIQEQNPHLYLINTIITDLVKEMEIKGE